MTGPVFRVPPAPLAHRPQQAGRPAQHRLPVRAARLAAAPESAVLLERQREVARAPPAPVAGAEARVVPASAREPQGGAEPAGERAAPQVMRARAAATATTVHAARRAIAPWRIRSAVRSTDVSRRATTYQTRVSRPRTAVRLRWTARSDTAFSAAFLAFRLVRAASPATKTLTSVSCSKRTGNVDRNCAWVLRQRWRSQSEDESRVARSDARAPFRSAGYDLASVHTHPALKRELAFGIRR